MALTPSFFGYRDIWDPFKDFLFTSPLAAFAFNPRIDWTETPEAHVFRVDCPWLKKEEVKVEIEDDRVLRISGERLVKKENKNDKWHRVERSSSKFLRRFRLPDDAKLGLDQVKVSMKNGALTVTVPKKLEVKESDAKDIEISG